MFFLSPTLAFTAAPQLPGSRLVLACLLGGMFCMMWGGARYGYWNGPIRQIAPTIALLIAGVCAWAFGAELGYAFFKHTFIPWLLRGFAGIVFSFGVIWLAACAVLWRIGRNRSPNPTGECQNPILGAIVGCWTGILWSVCCFFIIGVIGSVAQLWIDNTPLAPASLGRTVLEKLVVAKNSVALINGAEWLETWSPLPERAKRLMEKALRVLNTPGAMSRLQNLEQVRNIATNPAFYPITQDKEIQNLIINRDVEKLASHPAILRLLADDEFQQRIAATNLEQLFDEALEQAENARRDAPREPTGENAR